jgi:hypothetical protein
MKALTVMQPWAWAIFHGKAIENRTQLWTYRGPLAIHAGARWSERGGSSSLVRDAFCRANSEYNGGSLPEWLFTVAASCCVPGVHMGAILGVVDLVDVHPESGCCAPWGESSYVEHGGRERRQIAHLVLENARLLPKPIPCRGALGLWTPPADIAEKLKAVTNV